MKKRSFGRKAVCVLMMTVLAASMLAGCGKKDRKNGAGNAGTAGNGQEAVLDKDHVYHTEPFMQDLTGRFSYIQSLHKAGDRYWIWGGLQGSDPEKETLGIASFSEAGNDAELTEIGVEPGTGINCAAVTEDGRIYICYEWYGADEEEPAPEEDPAAGTEEPAAESEEPVAGAVEESAAPGLYLAEYDTDGQKLWEAPLSEEGEEGFYYIEKILPMAEGLLLTSYEGLALYDPESGRKIFSRRLEDDLQVDSYVVSADGSVYAVTCEYKETPDGYTSVTGLCRIDPKDGSFQEAGDLPAMAQRYSYYPGAGKDFCLTGSDGIYGLSVGDQEPAKYVDYIASDILPGIEYTAQLSDTEFLVLRYKDEGGSVMEKLIKTDPSEVKERTVLTLGCYYLDYRTRKQIVDFNRQNDTYRIQVSDYSRFDTEDDYEIGINRMNADIVSGNIPDIIVINEAMPLNAYISKGLFADLDPLLMADQELAGVEYMDNVLAANRFNGHLYFVASGFNVRTMAARTKVVGKEPGISASEMKKLARDAGIEVSRLFGPYDRNSAKYFMLSQSGGQFVDWENGTCSYNSGEFAELLELIREFPEELPDSVWEEQSEDMYRTGKALFMPVYLYDFRDYAYTLRGTFGEEITFTGFPNGGAADTSGSFLSFSDRMAISASCRHPQGAWEYVRMMLTEEYQDHLADEGYMLPVSRKALEKLAAKARKRPSYEDENGKIVEYDDYFVLNGQEIRIEPLTEEETDSLIAFIESVDHPAQNDPEIYTIIEEEAEAYFQGQKSAEDVSAIIQSRVQTYIDENR